MIWGLIIFSCLTAFLCRFFPFTIKNNKFLTHKDSLFYKFLSYSTQAMLGVIIYNTAFHNMNIVVFYNNFHVLSLVKIILLVIAFAWVAKNDNILPALICTLCIYLTCLVMILK